jgi:hypothetical protein
VLKDEQQQVERIIKSTSVTNYKAFLESAKCLDMVNQHLDSVCENLGLLLKVRLA